MFEINKNKLIKTLVFMLEFLAIGIIIYLIALPLYPMAKYKLSYQDKSSNIDWQDYETVKQKTDEILKDILSVSENNQNNIEEKDIEEEKKQTEKNSSSSPTQTGIASKETPQKKYNTSTNRIVIAKIGVNAPIIESTNGDSALSQGAWRIPESSTPDKIGNTVITGHRFKYLPASNLTFYLFHKLEKGDIVSIIWQKKNYYYKINEIKIVNPKDLSILEKTEKSILTLFTCNPIYSQKNRLVVIGELIED